MPKCDKAEVKEASNDVRNDGTDTNWATFVYDGSDIIVGASGTDYDELQEFVKSNDDRVYCYIRMQTGDEMSIRMKFAFVTFYGTSVSPISRAKCSTDKQLMSSLLYIEILISIKPHAINVVMEDTIDFDEILKQLRKAGGANYDAQA